jgi:hypothetical protein
MSDDSPDESNLIHTSSLSATPQLVVWNCNSIRSKHDQIDHFLHTVSPLALIVGESKLPPHSTPPHYKNYNSFHITHSGSSSGIIFYFHAALPAVQKPNLSFSIQTDSSSCAMALTALVSIKLRSGSTKQTAIISCYFPPQLSTSDQRKVRTKLSSALSKLESDGIPAIICGDVNCSSSLMGDSSAPFPAISNQFLEELVATHALISANDAFARDQPTRRGGSRVIDIALSSEAGLIENLRLGSDDFLHSDHLPLRISLAITPPTITYESKAKLILDGVTSDAFETEYIKQTTTVWGNTCLPSHPPDLLPDSLSLREIKQRQMDYSWSALCEILSSTANALGKRSKPRANGKSWWTAEIRVLFRIYKQASDALVAAKRSTRFSAEELHKLKLSRNVSHNAFRRLKFQTLRQNLQERVSKCTERDEFGNSKINWTEFSRISADFKPQPNNIKNSAGILPFSSSESAQNMADYVGSVFNAPNDFAAELIARKFEELERDRDDELDMAREAEVTLDPSFAAEDLDQILNHLNPRKASGADDISNRLLKLTGPTARKHLLQIFNWSHNAGVIPMAWHQSKCFSIHKKGDTSDPANYRIIALESCVLKVLERLMLNRITPIIEPTLHNLQFGFRKQHSTADALNTILRRIHSAINAKQALPIAFLDIKAAFDSIPVAKLLEKILRAPFFSTDKIWLRAFLSDRSFFVANRSGSSSVLPATNGVPQGSILAPLLFVYFIDDLPKYLSDCGCTCDCILYADDVALVPSATGEVAAEQLQHSLNNLHDWLDFKGLKLSTGSKNGVVLFRAANQALIPSVQLSSGALRKNRAQSLKLVSGIRNFKAGEVAIPVVSSYKYLGLILHQHLCWTEQFKALRGACNLAANAILRLVSKESNCTPNMILLLTESCLVSILRYYLPWITLSKRKCDILDSVMLRPIRCALGLKQNAHKLSLFMESGLLPTDLLQNLCILQTLRRWDDLRIHSLLFGSRLPVAVQAVIKEAQAYRWLSSDPIANCTTVQRALQICGALPVWRSDSAPQIPNNDKLSGLFRSLLQIRWSGVYCKLNDDLPNEQRRWGVPLKQIIFPNGLGLPFDRIVRQIPKPDYFDLPLPQAVDIASVRFDSFSPWRRMKIGANADSLFPMNGSCRLCASREEARMFHYIIDCTNPDIVNARHAVRYRRNRTNVEVVDADSLTDGGSSIHPNFRQLRKRIAKLALSFCRAIKRKVNETFTKCYELWVDSLSDVDVDDDD